MSFDTELVEQGLKPSPPTDEELAAIEEMAPGDYEIYSLKRVDTDTAVWNDFNRMRRSQVDRQGA